MAAGDRAGLAVAEHAVSNRAAELLDVLQLCLTFATAGSPERQAEVARDGRAALDELRELLATRQWPRVVRGGVPPGPHFLRLDDRALTGLLADTQDAYGDLQERLREVEAQLRDCQERLEAARTEPSASDDSSEESP